MPLPSCTAAGMPPEMLKNPFEAPMSKRRTVGFAAPCPWWPQSLWSTKYVRSKMLLVRSPEMLAQPTLAFGCRAMPCSGSMALWWWGASAKWDSAAACSGEGLAGGRPPGVQTSGEPEYVTQASAAAFISGCPEMLQIWPFAWPVSQTCSALDGWYVHGVVEFAAACFHGFVPGWITQRRSSASASAPRNGPRSTTRST
jgi:hypothetical protein